MKNPIAQLVPAALTVISSIVIFMPAVNGQDQKRPQCPTIAVDCPGDCPKPDKDIVFRAIMNEQPANTVTFNWSVSSGRIVRGQGTKTLTFRIDNKCRITTVTLNVDGLSPECPRMASCSTPSDCCWAPVAHEFDDFGDINCEDEMARLDMFAIQLQHQPAAQGYIIFYGGRSYHGRLARIGESEARASRLKTYLLRNRGIDRDRIVMMDGGYREKWSAELWVAPVGARPPTATPKFGRKDMKFRRGKIRKGEYSCAV